MAVGITISMEARDALRRLRRLNKEINTRDLLKSIGIRHLREVNDAFKREGRFGEKWKPLAASTVFARRKGSSAILQDTGRLRQSFVIEGPSGRSVSVGSNMKTAVIHQEGTGPYRITPKAKSFLTIPSAGGPVTFKGTKQGRLDGIQGFFSKGVDHPGLVARPMIPTSRRGEKLALAVLESEIKSAIRKAER